MNCSKSTRRPARMLLKATLLVGLLTTISVSEANDAAARNYGPCRTGYTKVGGVCMTYLQRRLKMIREAKANQPPPAPVNMCTMQMPITGQVVSVPCAAPAPATGTCPFQMPVTGQIVNLPC
jgi:hypothetical protein